MATRKTATKNGTKKTVSRKKPVTAEVGRTDVAQSIPLADMLTLVEQVAKRNKQMTTVLTDQLAQQSLRRLQRVLQELAAVGNVDEKEPDSTKRAKQFVDIVREGVTMTDGVIKDNVVTFLTRTGWHEGDDLRRRTQYPSGPGRGFLQMEPAAAKDGTNRAAQKGWLSQLATAAATTEANLKEAAKALALGSPWPAGNLIEDSLKRYDLFAVLLARAYLIASPASIPDKLDDQDDYWEAQWHRISDATKKAKWLADAKRLNKLLEWS